MVFGENDWMNAGGGSYSSADLSIYPFSCWIPDKYEDELD